MKEYRASVLREKNERELLDLLYKLKKELGELRFKSVVEKPANPARFRNLRRAIARIYTILREKQYARK